MRPYKGYVGTVEYSADDRCFHGTLLGIRDFVTYESGLIEGLQKAFEDSVDDYLEACKQFGREPQKPKSGKLAVRLAPEVHEMVATAAVADAKSINQWIADVLEDAATRRIEEGSTKIRIR